MLWRNAPTEIKRLIKILLPLGILLFGLLGMRILAGSKSRIRPTDPKPSLPLVRVIQVQKGEVPLTVHTQGTVLPHAETALASQVAAQVISVNPSFEVGGFVEPGEILLSLDSRDFLLAVEQAKARVAQARLQLAEQHAEARIASEEWQELGNGEPEPLVLREPQIAESQAVLSAAQAELSQARLDLERTQIRSPFTGRIRRKSVDIGQYLIPGQEVAILHAIDYAEVRLPITQHDLAFLDISLAYQKTGTLREGPRTSLSATFANRELTWLARIVRTEGELDSRSRMIHLVARVEDPYLRQSNADRPPLAVGLFVEAEIEGRTLHDTALLPRTALRNNNQVLIVNAEERLTIRPVEVTRVQGETVAIGAGLESGERICISPLDVVVEGMAVRTLEVENPFATVAETNDTTQTPEAEVDSSASEPPLPRPTKPLATASSSRLLAVLLESSEPVQSIQIDIDGNFTHSSFQLNEPDRFIIDLEGVIEASGRSTIQLGQGVANQVRISQFILEPSPTSRIVFDLTKSTAPHIKRIPTGLVVHLNTTIPES